MPIILSEIEPLLAAWSQGDHEARDALLAQVYPDLKRIASRHLSREVTGHTLDTTALVHEAFLDVLDDTAPEWQGRAQFFAFMSTVMRHVLVDHARARAAGKREGDRIRVALREDLLGEDPDPAELLDLEAALERLALHAPRLASVAESRIFGGMNDAEIGAAFGTSERTAARDWQRARAWLRVALDERHAG